MKKLISFLLAFAMVFSLAMPGMAAEDDTYTLYIDIGQVADSIKEVSGVWLWANDGSSNLVNNEQISYVSGTVYSYSVPSAITGGRFSISYTDGSSSNPDYYFSIESAGKNLYTPTGEYTGTWSTYGSAGGITGDTEGDVTASYTPVIKVTGMSIRGDNVTYDENTNTYTVVATETPMLDLVFSGTNLNHIAYEDSAYLLESTPTGEESNQVLLGVLFTSWYTYDEATGAMIQNSPYMIGYDTTYRISNNGGTTWEDGLRLVVKQGYAVTISDSMLNGTVTADKAIAAEDDTVTLTVTPEVGYELDELTVTYEDADGVTQNVIVTDNAFTMPAFAVTVTATFQQATETYTVTVDENIANGTVVVNPTTYTAGQTVTLAVNPDEGYKLTNLTVTNTATDEPVTVSENNTFVMPDGNVTVTAVFEALTAEITGLSITIDGAEYNSTNTSETDPAVITPNTQSLTLKVTGTNLQYNEHAIVSYAPSKNADTVLAGNEWSVSEDGTSATKDISAFLEVLSSTTSVWELQYANDGNTLLSSGVYVIYQVPTYAVNISAAIAGGTVTAYPNPAEEGQTVIVIVEPVAGYAYVVGSLKVINEATGLEVPVDEASKTFTMPDSTVMVSAEFEKLTVTSAEIVWGSMAFTYSEEQVTLSDGTTGDKGWSNDGSDKAGTVTVENTGTTAISVSATYASIEEYQEIEGTLGDAKTLAAAESGTFTLTLSGKPKKAIPGIKIGSVTVKIEEVK